MTAIYGLIGFPIVHSRSPKYFAEKFKNENRDAEYLPFELENIDELKYILNRYPDLKGFNVTIPYKKEIIPLLNEISEEAQAIGAVNCVKVKRGNGQIQLSGYNTDAPGFRKSLLNFIPQGIGKALILGNGGAAKAIRYVLENLGMKVLIVSRSPKNTDEISYAEIPAYLADHRLIVNTTPLGMWPRIHRCPDFPFEALTPEHYLYDLIYNPEMTSFMEKGKAAGAQVKNGLDMWKEQADLSWEIWKDNN